MEELNKCQKVLMTIKYQLEFQSVLLGWSRIGFICNQIQFAFTDWLLLVKQCMAIHHVYCHSRVFIDLELLEFKPCCPQYHLVSIKAHIF